jgi:hypothetical protein
VRSTPIIRSAKAWAFGGFRHAFGGAAQVVGHAQHVAGKGCHRIGLGIRHFLLGATAQVFHFRHQAQQPVAQIVTLSQSHRQWIRRLGLC